MGAYIIEGSGTIDENGALDINLPISELERLDLEQHQQLTLEATVQAEGEYPLSERGTAVLHPADFYIGVRPESWTGQAGQELSYSIRTVDWQGSSSGEHVPAGRIPENLVGSCGNQQLESQRPYSGPGLFFDRQHGFLDGC